VSDENKENWRLDEYLNDQDGWNDSIISGASARQQAVTRSAVVCSFRYAAGYEAA